MFFAHSGRSAAPIHQTGSQSKPRAEKQKKIACHPHPARIAEARGNATIDPAYPPLQQKAAAREYSRGGNQRANMALIAGKVPPSPMPRRIRTTIRTASDFGRGVSAVNKLHQAMLTMNIRL